MSLNLEIFKRNVSMFKLGIAELDMEELKIYEFLITNLSGLKIYTYNRNSDDILFFGKSADSIVLKYNSGLEILWVEYDKIWSYLMGTALYYNDAISLISWWVEIEIGVSLLVKEIYSVFTYPEKQKLIER